MRGRKAVQREVLRGRCGCLSLFFFQGARPGKAALSLPHLSYRRPEKPLLELPPTPAMGQGCTGDLEVSSRASWWAPRGQYIGEGCAVGSWGKAGCEEGSRWGEGGEEAGEGGGGSEPAWSREVGLSSPRRSGGGLTGGGSILSLALSLCLPIRSLSLGSTRIPGTENGAIAYASRLREGGGGGEVKFPVKNGPLG